MDKKAAKLLSQITDLEEIESKLINAAHTHFSIGQKGWLSLLSAKDMVGSIRLSAQCKLQSLPPDSLTSPLL